MFLSTADNIDRQGANMYPHSGGSLCTKKNIQKIKKRLKREVNLQKI